MLAVELYCLNRWSPGSTEPEQSVTAPTSDVIKRRIDELLAVTCAPGDQDAIYATVAQVQYGAMTLADALYGAGSIQVTELREVAARVRPNRRMSPSTFCAKYCLFCRAPCGRCGATLMRVSLDASSDVPLATPWPT